MPEEIEIVDNARIINRGRGPEIAGTRITIYDVMDYLSIGWHRDRIAGFFRLSSPDIQAAIDYIEANQEEANAQYEKIVERHKNYQYTPEVLEKLKGVRGLASARVREFRERFPEAADVEADCGP